MRERQQLTAELRVAPGSRAHAPQLLAAASGLSVTRVKDAMQKGAVWLTTGQRKPRRLRQVTYPLQPGDHLALYYDSDVLSRVPPRAVLLADFRRYSVWNKPVGLLVEGSRYGDHATLAMQVSEHFAGRRAVHLVHRLDLEAQGIVVIAHGSQATAMLSALWRERQVDKRYLVSVRGRLGDVGARGVFDSPLDGKASRTEYAVLQYDALYDVSELEITMWSGRYHQIRRHCAQAGHPVMGDPKYGTRNSDPRGLQLAAVRVCFTDPWTHEGIDISLPAKAAEIPVARTS